VTYDDAQKRAHNRLARAIYREDVLDERIARDVLPRPEVANPAANRMIALDAECREHLETCATAALERDWPRAMRAASAWKRENAKLAVAKDEYTVAAELQERHPEGRLYRVSIDGKLYAFPLILRWSTRVNNLEVVNASDYEGVDFKALFDLACWAGSHGVKTTNGNEDTLVWKPHVNGSLVLRNHINAYYPNLPGALEAIRTRLIPLGGTNASEASEAVSQG
jgi:hypothetical protein